jgi:hypothetical protein
MALQSERCIVKEKILAYLTEPRTINDIAAHIQSNYPITKNILVEMRDANVIHAYKDNQDRLMHYYVPQPHPLQTIFGHTANFTDDQIKGIIIHNADDAKHNLQQRTTQETFGQSVAYTLTQYD